jgi:hypothetical protein
LQRQVCDQWQFALETLVPLRKNSGTACGHAGTTVASIPGDASRKTREHSGNRNVVVTLTEAEIATSESVSTLLTDHDSQGRLFFRAIRIVC